MEVLQTESTEKNIQTRHWSGTEARGVQRFTKMGMTDVANTPGRSDAMRIVKHLVTWPTGRLSVNSVRVKLLLKVHQEEEFTEKSS